MNKYFPHLALGILVITCGAFLYGSFHTPEAMTGAVLTRYMTGSTSMAAINNKFDAQDVLIATAGANGANCSAGQAPLGVDGANAVESCFDVWTEAENTSAGYISDGNTLWNNTYGLISTSSLIVGATDEYCLTYEDTGATLSWQTCGTGVGDLSAYLTKAYASSTYATILSLNNHKTFASSTFAKITTLNNYKAFASSTFPTITTLNNHKTFASSTYVVGPSSATDNAVARFDLTTGRLIQNSALFVDDTTGAIRPATVSGANGNPLILNGGQVTGGGGYAGGDILLNVGSSGADARGVVKLPSHYNQYFAKLSAENITGNYLFTFPNATGTFAVITNGRLTAPNITANLTGTASSAQAVLLDGVAEITDIAASLKDGSGDCSSGLICLGDHTHSSYLTTVASDSTWTGHNSYPSACSAGQYVTQIGDTLTCSAPSSLGYISDGNTGWNNTYGLVSSSSLAVGATDEYCLTYEETGGIFSWQTCAVGGTGTVNTGSAGQIAYYAANGTAVSGTSTIDIAADGVGIYGPAQSGMNGASMVVSASYINGDYYSGDVHFSAGSINSGLGEGDGALMWATGAYTQGANIYGGDLFLVAGTGTTTGKHGYVKIESNSSSDQYAKLDTSALSSDKYFSFPDLSGTLAVIDTRGRLTLPNITANLTGTASSAQAVVNGAVGVAGLASVDFGAFTCNGSACSLDATYDNYSSWTLQDGDSTTYTITSADTLQIANGTGISSNFTADDVLTIAVADNYLLNNGDVGTGAYDFGGADYFEIPNGAGPTCNDPGEICHDTSDNQLIVDDYVMGTGVQNIWSVTVASTSQAFMSDGLLPFSQLLDGYTITAIRCYVSGGTSKVVAIEDASANSSEDITCDADGAADDGSITNATFTAGELGNIDFGATSGAVNYVTISVFGTWTRE